jgi:NAD(P)H-hydrate epimerase
MSALVFAGKGNNGGDGYVIARLLSLSGWEVSLIVLSEKDAITGDAAVNLDRLPDDVTVAFCGQSKILAQQLASISRHQLIVDAIFGTGLSSTVSGVYLEAIRAVNASGKPVVSVDIPSGVHGTTGEILGDAVKADLTVTLAAAKLGNVLYPGAALGGTLTVADIGIPADLIHKAMGHEFIDLEAAGSMMVKRSPASHKGSFGHTLILAGSTGHTGAAALAGEAAVRSGAGLVTVAVPSSLNQIFEIKLTEAMTLPLDDMGRGYMGCGSLPEIFAGVVGKNVIAIGPGLSRQPDTAELVRYLLETISLPMVLDADGLNALSENLSVLARRKSPLLIMTPHPGEMSRLTGLSVKEIEADRVGIARNFAMQNDIYLVLKGARTVIAAPDGRIAINSSGNPGMASGGMGDVLTGVIASLLGQGYGAFEAACLSVFIHGFSADLVALEKGTMGITASDVIEKLPFTFKNVNDCNSGF